MGSTKSNLRISASGQTNRAYELVCIELNPGPKGKKGNKSSRRGPSRPRRTVTSRNRPAQHSTNIRLSHTYRFSNLTNAVGQITSAKILGSCGTMCTLGNTTAANLFESFRIRKFSVWSPPPGQGSFTTCSIDWVGTSQAPAVEISDTSNSVATPAFISSAPPPSSNASFWQTPGIASVALFNYVIPSGSIIDLELDLILLDDDAIQTSNTIATGTVGNVYYLPLDGTTTHLLTPVSLTTTF